jgi:iron complex transport system substrate-binding protein
MRICKKNAIILALLIFAMILLSSCDVDEPTSPDHFKTICDSEGNEFIIPEDARVVCAYGSYAECWILSGGELVGVTEDAVSERKLELGEKVTIIGSVKSVDLERLVALRPDLVILSADLSAHRQLAGQLADHGITAGLFRVDSFADYDRIMQVFCDFNGGDEPYRRYVTEVKARIDSILLSVPESVGEKTALIMRAYSNGIKVKTDTLAEDIARELGCISLAEKYPSLLTDLSVEQIAISDPDYIFVLTMGDEK